MRWSHEGVSLRSPVRAEQSIRRTTWVLLACFALLNALWFVAIAPPPESAGYETCLVPSERTTPLCESLRPSWMTWDHSTLASYASARACTVAHDEQALTRMGRVESTLGIESMRNLDFLRMVRAQEGSCEMPPGEARMVEREYEELLALEATIWRSRVDRAVSSETSWISARSAWHAAGTRWLPLWMPALLLGWITLLVATRRMNRLVQPFELEVGTAGVRIDGRTIPRTAIAYLALEGRRLRIERWLGPPVYSRPLPPEALANVDEICGAIGLWDEESEPVERRDQRLALDRLVRAT